MPVPEAQAISDRKKVEPGLQTPSQVPQRAASQTSEPKHQLEEDQSRGPTHSVQVLNLCRLYGNTLDEEKTAARVCSH